MVGVLDGISILVGIRVAAAGSGGEVCGKIVAAFKGIGRLLNGEHPERVIRETIRATMVRIILY